MVTKFTFLHSKPKETEALKSSKADQAQKPCTSPRLADIRRPIRPVHVAHEVRPRKGYFDLLLGSRWLPARQEFWIPIRGGFQKSSSVGNSCLCGPSEVESFATRCQRNLPPPCSSDCFGPAQKPWANFRGLHVVVQAYLEAPQQTMSS